MHIPAWFEKSIRQYLQPANSDRFYLFLFHCGYKPECWWQYCLYDRVSDLTTGTIKKDTVIS